MSVNASLSLRFGDGPIEETQPLMEGSQEQIPSANGDSKNQPEGGKPGEQELQREDLDKEDLSSQEGLPVVSIYSLKSSQKIESPAERGFLTFMKTLVATGVLALPFVIQQVGLIPAWVLLLVIGYINFRTMQLVDEVANALNVRKVDFGRLAEQVTGRKWFRYFTEINVHIMQIGGCLPCLAFDLQYLDKVSCLYGWSAFCENKPMQVLLILVLVLPIGSITDLHYLSIPSGIGLLFQTAFYLTFLVICGQRIHEYGIATESFTAYNFHYLPIAFASILFAYEGIGLLLEIRASVASKKEFSKVLRYAFVASTITYTVFGTVGKLAFGDSVEPVIFMNLDQNNKFIVLLEVGYLFALMISLPAAIFPPIRIIESWGFLRNWIMDKETNKKSKWKRQFIRQPLLLLIVLVAAIAPSFNIVISLLGGMNFTILSFVLPVIMYNTQFKNDPKKRWHRFGNWLILIAGIILGACATVQSIYEIFKPLPEETLV